MYHSRLADAAGELTYLPWRAEAMTYEKLLPPRETVRERDRVPIAADARGPFVVRAVLRDRSAPQEVLDALYGQGRFPLQVVDMAEAEARR